MGFDDDDDISKEAAARADPYGMLDYEEDIALEGRDAGSGPADSAAVAAAERTSCWCSNWFSGEVGSGAAMAADDTRWPDDGRGALAI